MKQHSFSQMAPHHSCMHYNSAVKHNASSNQCLENTTGSASSNIVASEVFALFEAMGKL